MAKRLSIQLYNAKKGESITLPLNPETTDIPNERDIRTYNILGYGEVPVKGNKQLIRINLTNLLPEEDTYFALLASLVKNLDYRSYSMNETKDMINSWIENQDVIRVIIAGHLNGLFLIERYISNVRESVPDLGYSIDLIEYRNPAAETSTSFVDGRVQKLRTRPINVYIPSYKVAAQGDTIYKIAMLTYGGRWQELAERNNITDANADISGQRVEMLPL